MINIAISLTVEQFEEMAKALYILNKTNVGQFKTEDLINFLIDNFNELHKIKTTLKLTRIMPICLN